MSLCSASATRFFARELISVFCQRRLPQSGFPLCISARIQTEATISLHFSASSPSSVLTILRPSSSWTMISILKVFATFGLSSHSDLLGRTPFLLLFSQHFRSQRGRHD